jgi:hypothetical protein
VLTGILLGPSVMGFVPGFTETIFPTSSIPTFKGLAFLFLRRSCCWLSSHPHFIRL